MIHEKYFRPGILLLSKDVIYLSDGITQHVLKFFPGEYFFVLGMKPNHSNGTLSVRLLTRHGPVVTTIIGVRSFSEFSFNMNYFFKVVER